MLQEILRYLDDNGVDSEVLDGVFEIAFKYNTKCRNIRGGKSYFDGKYDVCDEVFGDTSAGINGLLAKEVTAE